MGTWLVTVKLPRNPAHDPRNKVTGPCPLGTSGECTDVTGEHHTFLAFGEDASEVHDAASLAYGHVTRIERTVDTEEY